MAIGDLLGRFRPPRIRARAPVVAVLRLAGVIGQLGPLRGGLTLAGLAGAIERAFRLRRLAAVALVVNSPGGSAVQSGLIARRIRAFAAERKVPVLAFAEDVAASGGYWLALAADEIYAQDGSIVGSIGVRFSGFGFADLLRRVGIERRLYTAGARKSLLDPFQKEDPDDVARLRALQAEIHAGFIAEVRSRRGARLRGAEEVLFSGDFWTGARALELGLIDGIGEMREVLRARYGERVRIRPVEGPRAWLRWRGGLSPGRGAADFALELIAAIEERLLWGRFGL
ncbi:MAG: S49 family peptidase [Proteobacteria bacterium]|nr:S49 family peptidase [Pseudomonadota bacterium]